MTPCPTDAELNDLLRERPAPAERQVLDRHIEQCPKCLSALERLTTDPLICPAKSLDASNTTLTLAKPVLPQGGMTRSIVHLLMPAQQPGALGRLAHYEVLAVLGQGGFGAVFKALDGKLQRVVAVKVLAPYLAGVDSYRQRFLREARAAAAVKDAHIVGIYAVEEEPFPYLVMEYLAGETLQQRLERVGRLTVEDICTIGGQIATGLAAAHRHKVIHRDVKPGNLFLEEGSNKIKLTDFGLARTTDDVHLTQTGLIAGTPLYMSPEQARGDTIDERSDLFSLGSVLYVMATGRPAFGASAPLAVLRRVCDETPIAACDLNPDLPRWLGTLIARLHAKSADARVPSAAEVARILATGAVEPGMRGPAKYKRLFKRRAQLAALVLAASAGLVWIGSRPGSTLPGPDMVAASGADKSVELLPPPARAENAADGQADLIAWLQMQNPHMSAGVEQGGRRFDLYDGVLPGPFKVRSLRLHPTNSRIKLTDGDMPRFSVLHDLEELDIDRQPITDAGFSHLAPLKELRTLRIIFTRMSPASADIVRGFSKLENLCVPDPDAWLKALAGMPSLRVLNFYGQALPTTALQRLATFPNLERVTIDWCNVEEASLRLLLTEVKQLRTLHLNDIGRDAACCARLAREFPNCEIHYQDHPGEVPRVFNRRSDQP